jgi:hypothetical protein
MDGRSLTNAIENNSDASIPAYSMTYHPSTSTNRKASSLRNKRWKFISRDSGWNYGRQWADESFELYNLRADPREEKNLASTSPEDIKIFKEMIYKYQRFLDERELYLTPEIRARLKSLGYLR